jgi:transposase
MWRLILGCRRRRCGSTCGRWRRNEGRRKDLLTNEEREEIRKLRKEKFELRRANEILKAASVFFCKELDPDRPR